MSANVDADAAVQRFAVLAPAGEVLASSLDYEQTPQVVARLAVPTLGDVCVVDIVEKPIDPCEVQAFVAQG